MPELNTALQQEGTQQEGQTRDFIVSNGIRLRATVYGDPSDQPVILAHGGGQTRHSWGNTARVLADKGFFAIAYDHRGHGDSEWSADGAYPLPLFAEDLAHIAREFDTPPVAVGASLGGLAAMLAADQHDTAFNAIVLVDITPNMSQQGARNVIDFMSTHMEEGFASLEDAAVVIAEYTKRPLRKNVDGLKKNLRLDNDGRYRWHWDPAFTRERMEMHDDKLGMPDRMWAALTNTSTPLLLVRGARSDLVTEELAQEFLQRVPHAEYVDVENAHHMVAGDRNDIFSKGVVEFIERLS